MADNQTVGEALQALEAQQSNKLLRSFLVIAEYEMPDAPDDIAYHYYWQGTPAEQLGLSSYLGTAVHERIFSGDD